MAEYTPRVDGFQIRDITYIGRPPKNEPIKYAIVKWETADEPYEAIDARTGKPKMITEYCYVVADLAWNPKEPCFELQGIGLRLLESRPTDAAIDMILDFCERKSKELYGSEDDWS